SLYLYAPQHTPSVHSLPTRRSSDLDKGVPTKLDGEELPLEELIMKLDKLAGKHGIVRIDHVENRLVGIKSREVYFQHGKFYQYRSEEHTSELKSRFELVCRLLRENK